MALVDPSTLFAAVATSYKAFHWLFPSHDGKFRVGMDGIASEEQRCESILVFVTANYMDGSYNVRIRLPPYARLSSVGDAVAKAKGWTNFPTTVCDEERFEYVQQELDAPISSVSCNCRLRLYYGSNWPSGTETVTGAVKKGFSAAKDTVFDTSAQLLKNASEAIRPSNKT